MTSAMATKFGKRKVIAEDADAEELITRGLTAERLNPLLTRGPLELVPGVLRKEGREPLARMGKLRQPTGSEM